MCVNEAMLSQFRRATLLGTDARREDASVWERVVRVMWAVRGEVEARSRGKAWWDQRDIVEDTRG
jgi:hypothetical protein